MTVLVSGTAGYIADFSNATVASRQSFQTSTANGSTGIYALPNGTSTAASWQATNAADPTNASKILIATNGSTDVQLVSGRNGTGTYLPLTFYTNGSEQMRLDASGNLGIGTSSPAQKLDVALSQNATTLVNLTNANSGTASRAGFSSNSDTVSVNLYATSSGYTGVSSWQGAGVISVGSGSTNGLILNCQGSKPIQFQINTGEVMRLDSSGNLGLGVTPSAWGTYKAVQVGNASLSTSSASGTTAYITGNGYYNGTNWIYQVNDYASRYACLYGNGTHAWFTAPSGTAGTAITFTQAMTLDASGNLGIGTSSPAQKLDISAAGAQIALRSTDTTAARFRGYVNGSESGVIGFLSGGGQYFETVGTERMRLDASGNLLVGATTKPLTNLRMYVQGADTSSTAYAFMAGDSSQNTLLYIRNDGLYVTGTQGSSPYNNTTASAANMVVTSTGQLQRSTSSLKYKTNVQDSVHGLSDLLKLRSVTYEGRAETDAGKTFGGLIAEEVHDAGLTEFVQYNIDNEPDALAYGNMVSLCVKAIQEQQLLIQQLQADVAALKGA